VNWDIELHSIDDKYRKSFFGELYKKVKQRDEEDKSKAPLTSDDMKHQ
jgi:hypothetical protein